MDFCSRLVEEVAERQVHDRDEEGAVDVHDLFILFMFINELSFTFTNVILIMILFDFQLF